MTDTSLKESNKNPPFIRTKIRNLLHAQQIGTWLEKEEWMSPAI